jgi:hypothetical protein
MDTVAFPADPVPHFICPTCGYFGESTWESYETEELGQERLDFGCRELLGMILIDHLKGYPFQLACLHPDGTYGYAPEVAPGQRHDVDKGCLIPRQVTPEEVRALHQAGPPLSALVDDAAIEQKIYRILAGLLYATYNPLARDRPLLNFSEHFCDQGWLIADYQYGLSETSPLAHYYSDSDDLNFTGLQEEVLRLIQPHYWVVVDVGLDWALEEDHSLTPAEIREALAPQDDDEAPDDDDA